MTKPKTVGLLYGMERTFPEALAKSVNERAGGRVVAQPVKIGAIRHDDIPEYDIVVDRISHEVSFYRTYLKAAAARGTQVINNPFWWSADDKFFNNVVAQAAGVAVPRTVILPHKEHPPGTKAESFTNLVYPVDWDAVFSYLKFPIFLKPAYGGGWKDVYKVGNPEEFFSAFSSTHTLCMMAQEAIEFTEYYRCYGIGRSKVRVMRYDPKAPFHERYVKGAPKTEPALEKRMTRDAIALCEALGYDLNTIEFAVRDGIPYAIDFMNPAPDADVNSVGQENFDWVVAAVTDLLIERALKPKGLELTGSWPALLASSSAARPSAAETRPAPAPARSATSPGAKGKPAPSGKGRR